MHERAVNGSKVVLQGSCEGQTNVDYSVARQRQHVMFEVLIEEVLCLVHHLFAHDNVELAALVVSLLTVSKVVLDNLDDCSLLVSLISKLVQDGCEGSCSSTRHSCNAIFTELEEHGQKVGVNDASIEQTCVLPQVLRKHFFCTPVRASLIKSLSDVLDVGLTLDLGYLGQEDVQVLHNAEPHVWIVMLEEAVSNRKQILVSQLWS